VMDRLRAEAARGRTIVLTTQILTEAEELCDDILILNRGRELARGDLHSLKLLSEGVYELSMTFDRLPPDIESRAMSWNPVRIRTTHNTIELTLKEREPMVLELARQLSELGRVLRIEVSGASLEDVFIELTGRTS
jgi:ABC-2 type transport system ATP-binding protein